MIKNQCFKLLQSSDQNNETSADFLQRRQVLKKYLNSASSSIFNFLTFVPFLSYQSCHLLHQLYIHLYTLPLKIIHQHHKK